MPRPTARALVVSLHDVSPRTQPVCARILDELAALGVAHTSLLVIPDHHRRGHFLADESFCEWLREKERAGHEIVTHGYYHQRARRSGESAMQKITTRIYTADEGEFFDLDRETARGLVAKANAELAQAGVHPRGFIAPAWLLGSEAEAALRELGVEYTTARHVADCGRPLVGIAIARGACARRGARAEPGVERGALPRAARQPADADFDSPGRYRHAAVWRQMAARARR